VPPTAPPADRRTQRRVLREAARRRRPVAGEPGIGRRIAHAPVALWYALRRLTRGDRPLLAVLAGALALAVVLLSGPAQSYLDGRARVDTLALKADALETENQRLTARAGDLEDPATIELLAREQQGFIRPGEVPYTLVPPEVDRPLIAGPRTGPHVEAGAWYERAWQAVRGWFG
jgi:cell division protein FtsB